LPKAQDKAKAGLDKATRPCRRLPRRWASQQQPKRRAAGRGGARSGGGPQGAGRRGREGRASRRAEIAKLEEADRKLDELIKAEKNIADKAKSADTRRRRPEGFAGAGQKQGEVTPPTREVAKDLKALVPEAAKRSMKAPASMDDARAKLDRRR